MNGATFLSLRRRNFGAQPHLIFKSRFHRGHHLQSMIRLHSITAHFNKINSPPSTASSRYASSLIFGVDSSCYISSSSNTIFDSTLLIRLRLQSRTSLQSHYHRVISLLPMFISDSLNSNEAHSKLFNLAFAQHQSSFSASSASPPALIHIQLPTIALNSQHVLGSFTMKSEMEGNKNTICY
ncbi:hypothetical protein RYX36_027781 [Vicia faba]